MAVFGQVVRILKIANKYNLMFTFVSVGKVPVFCVSVAQQHILLKFVKFTTMYYDIRSYF